jgi:threonyl-tRNA synthetase
MSPGSPFWHPKGMVIWNALEDLRRRENLRRGYLEVKTPIIFDKSLWETSGHWEKFREDMFLIEEEGRTWALKPMNCPGHILVFGNRMRSYRELPLRLAEAAPLHRNELAGTLHGLTRVRHVTQDDSHIFCTREQIEEEVFGCLDFTEYLYGLFDLEFRFELSTRPENKLGTEEEWDFTEGALQAALDRRGLDYEVNEGDGAFYGPKIDLHMTDSLGRSWQMGTIQLDSQMPGRFGVTYVGPDNHEHTPYMIHRASFGSLERFIGILIEHYAGAFPLWLAPVQVQVIPVGEDHREAAQALAGKLGEFRVEVDDSDETVGKRIRNAEVAKIPYVLVWGDKESEGAIAVRTHGGEQSTKSLDELLGELRQAATV